MVINDDKNEEKKFSGLFISYLNFSKLFFVFLIVMNGINSYLKTDVINNSFMSQVKTLYNVQYLV